MPTGGGQWGGRETGTGANGRVGHSKLSPAISSVLLPASQAAYQKTRKISTQDVWRRGEERRCHRGTHRRGAESKEAGRRGELS